MTNLKPIPDCPFVSSTFLPLAKFIVYFSEKLQRKQLRVIKYFQIDALYLLFAKKFPNFIRSYQSISLYTNLLSNVL